MATQITPAIRRLRKEARAAAPGVAVTWDNAPRVLGIAPWDAALVEADDSVLVLDSVSDTYTRCHSLTTEQQDEIRALAQA
jgi:hypothetical protein